jgi:predicted acylesterase/phospholipase RssA
MTRSQATPRAPRRALVFAGGGVKVAYQAGAVQVLLDEAGIEFDLADGASGGVFNLAMWCQGMTGRQIADNWRNYQPLGDFSPNLGAWLRGPWGASVLTARGLRRHTLTGFGLDWHAIRSTSREAVFELFNVSRQELQPVPAAQITEDRLLSAVALPMWFPPARIDGDTYIDAVFATDGNLEEMIRRGADELWVIWTVSTRGRWAPGFVAEYFLMIEAVANSGLRQALQRIEQNNTDIAAGRPGAYDRPITVHLISAEVPLGYLLNFRRSSFVRAVDLGVRDTRAWCARRGIRTRPVPPGPDPGGTVSAGTVSAGTAPAGTSSRGTTCGVAAADGAGSDRGAAAVRFHEVMKGQLTVGETASESTARMVLDLDVAIRDLDAFLADPGHTAEVSGSVRCAAFGGRLPLRSGTLRLLTDAACTEGTEKNMTYDLAVTDRLGRALRVHGVKRLVRGARPEIWADSTSLTTEVRDEAAGRVVAAGILRISVSGFLRQLATFRATAATARGRAGALARFGGFFADQLSQVYVRPVRPMPPPPWLAVPRPAATPALDSSTNDENGTNGGKGNGNGGNGNGTSGRSRRGQGITSRAAARR